MVYALNIQKKKKSIDKLVKLKRLWEIKSTLKVKFINYIIK